VGQSLPSVAVAAARLAQRPDPLELWRIADRVARHAEIRVRPEFVALLRAGTRSAAVDEALALRQKANELLRTALADLGEAAAPEPGQGAQALSA
jgi:hypothetical protein